MVASEGQRVHKSRFFFQAEDGIRDGRVTGVQTCALPILTALTPVAPASTGATTRATLTPPACSAVISLSPASRVNTCSTATSTAIEMTALQAGGVKIGRAHV